MSNTRLLGKANRRIDTAYSQHRVDTEVMLVIEMRDEIERLNSVLEHADAEIESLFKLINESRGEQIEVIRRMKVVEK